jgi:hypothetical protein
MLDAGFFLIENRVSPKGQARIEYLVPKGWIPKIRPNENQRQNNITNIPHVFNLESQVFLIKFNWRKNRAASVRLTVVTCIYYDSSSPSRPSGCCGLSFPACPFGECFADP